MVEYIDEYNEASRKLTRRQEYLNNLFRAGKIDREQYDYNMRDMSFRWQHARKRRDKEMFRHEEYEGKREKKRNIALNRQRNFFGNVGVWVDSGAINLLHSSKKSYVPELRKMKKAGAPRNHLSPFGPRYGKRKAKKRKPFQVPADFRI